MISRKFCLSLSVLLLAIGIKAGYAETAGEYELKAALLYKFAQFTDWPAPARERFQICVLGKNPFGDGLTLLSEKSIHGIAVEVQQLDSADNAKSCQVLFLVAPSRNQLSQWLNSLKNSPVLTVSDNPAAWDEGVMILLNTEPNRIAFSINASVAKQAGIGFRAQMLQLAREVR